MNVDAKQRNTVDRSSSTTNGTGPVSHIPEHLEQTCQQDSRNGTGVLQCNSNGSCDDGQIMEPPPKGYGCAESAVTVNLPVDSTTTESIRPVYSTADSRIVFVSKFSDPGIGGTLLQAPTTSQPLSSQPPIRPSQPYSLIAMDTPCNASPYSRSGLAPKPTWSNTVPKPASATAVLVPKSNHEPSMCEQSVSTNICCAGSSVSSNTEPKSSSAASPQLPFSEGLTSDCYIVPMLPSQHGDVEPYLRTPLLPARLNFDSVEEHKNRHCSGSEILQSLPEVDEGAARRNTESSGTRNTCSGTQDVEAPSATHHHVHTTTNLTPSSHIEMPSIRQLASGALPCRTKPESPLSPASKPSNTDSAVSRFQHEHQHDRSFTSESSLPASRTSPPSKVQLDHGRGNISLPTSEYDTPGRQPTVAGKANGVSLEDKERSWVDFLTNVGSTDVSDSGVAQLSMPQGISSLASVPSSRPQQPAHVSSAQFTSKQSDVTSIYRSASTAPNGGNETRDTVLGEICTARPQQKVSTGACSDSLASSAQVALNQGHCTTPRPHMLLNWASFPSTCLSYSAQSTAAEVPPFSQPCYTTSQRSNPWKDIPTTSDSSALYSGSSAMAFAGMKPPQTPQRLDQAFNPYADYSLFNAGMNMARSPMAPQMPSMWPVPTPGWPSGYPLPGNPPPPYYPFYGGPPTGYLPPYPPQMSQYRLPAMPFSQSMYPSTVSSASQGYTSVQASQQPKAPHPATTSALPQQVHAPATPSHQTVQQPGLDFGGFPQQPVELSSVVLNSGAQVQKATQLPSSSKPPTPSPPQQQTPAPAAACAAAPKTLDVRNEPLMDDMSKYVDPLWLLMAPAAAGDQAVATSEQLSDEVTAMLARDPLSVFASAAALMTSTPSGQAPLSSTEPGPSLSSLGVASQPPQSVPASQEKAVVYPMDASCEAVRKRRSGQEPRQRNKRQRRSAPATDTSSVVVAPTCAQSTPPSFVKAPATSAFTERSPVATSSSASYFSPSSFCHGNSVWSSVYPSMPHTHQGSEFPGPSADMCVGSCGAGGVWHNPILAQERLTGGASAPSLSTRVSHIDIDHFRWGA